MDFTEIALIIVLILLILAGGYIKKLSGAVKKLIVTFDNAIQDGNIDKDEWHGILQGGKGVLKVVRDIVSLVALKKRG